MNMWAKDKAGNGKLYDKSTRFRLIIEVFGSLDDPHSAVLRRLAKGTQAGHETLQEAFDAQQEYLRLAHTSLRDSSLACYGMTIVIDGRDGCCHEPVAITEKDVQ